MGLNTLVKTDAEPNTAAGGSKTPFRSEAWDAIARYIYTGLQDGSIMKGWMKAEGMDIKEPPAGILQLAEQKKIKFHDMLLDIVKSITKMRRAAEIKTAARHLYRVIYSNIRYTGR